MKFVELFGMPATGKTFAIDILKKKAYEKKERKIFIYFKKRSILSIFFKLKFIFFSFVATIKSSTFRNTINFFLKEYRPIKSTFISLRSLSIIFNSIFLISVIEIYGKSRISKDIYLDQGFFQILFSILYEMDLLNGKDLENIITKWLQNITSINKNIFLFYCNSKDDVIIKRLLERNGDSIIENKKIDKKDFKKYKKIFENILNFLINRKEEYPNIFLQSIDLDDCSNDLFTLE